MSSANVDKDGTTRNSATGVYFENVASVLFQLALFVFNYVSTELSENPVARLVKKYEAIRVIYIYI